MRKKEKWLTMEKSRPTPNNPLEEVKRKNLDALWDRAEDSGVDRVDGLTKGDIAAEITRRETPQPVGPDGKPPVGMTPDQLEQAKRQERFVLGSWGMQDQRKRSATYNRSKR
jgi:hypothetical protein